MVIACHVRHSNVAKHYVTRSFSASAGISGNLKHWRSALPDQLDAPKKNNGKLIPWYVICHTFHQIRDPIHLVVFAISPILHTPAHPHFSLLPQVVETQTPQTQDAPGEFVLYDEYMTGVYVADALTEERSAIWTPVSKPPSLRVRMHLSVKVKRPNIRP